MFKLNTLQKLSELTDISTVADVAAMRVLNSATEFALSDFHPGGDRIERVEKLFASVNEGDLSRARLAMTMMIACLDYENSVICVGTGARPVRPLEEHLAEALAQSFAEQATAVLARADALTKEIDARSAPPVPPAVQALKALEPFALAARSLKEFDHIHVGLYATAKNDDAQVWTTFALSCDCSDLDKALELYEQGDDADQEKVIELVRHFAVVSERIDYFDDYRQPIAVAVKNEGRGTGWSYPQAGKLEASHLYHARFVAEVVLKLDLSHDDDDAPAACGM